MGRKWGWGVFSSDPSFKRKIFSFQIKKKIRKKSDEGVGLMRNYSFILPLFNVAIFFFLENVTSTFFLFFLFVFLSFSSCFRPSMLLSFSFLFIFLFCQVCYVLTFQVFFPFNFYFIYLFIYLRNF